MMDLFADLSVANELPLCSDCGDRPCAEGESYCYQCCHALGVMLASDFDDLYRRDDSEEKEPVQHCSDDSEEEFDENAEEETEAAVLAAMQYRPSYLDSTYVTT